MPTRILGIESSCDETAAAVVADGRDILSSVVASQMDLHRKYGGVGPEHVACEHARRVGLLRGSESGCGVYFEAVGRGCGLCFEPAGKKCGLYFYAERLQRSADPAYRGQSGLTRLPISPSRRQAGRCGRRSL